MAARPERIEQGQGLTLTVHYTADGVAVDPSTSTSCVLQAPDGTSMGVTLTSTTTAGLWIGHVAGSTVSQAGVWHGEITGVDATADQGVSAFSFVVERRRVGV